MSVINPPLDNWYTLSSALYICLKNETGAHNATMIAIKTVKAKHPEIDFGETRQWSDWQARL